MGRAFDMPVEAQLRAGQPAPEPGVEKIAVLRANLLGDLIVSLPALDALRAAYPRAEIVLLARDWHRRLLEARPGPVDRVIVIPELPGLREDARPAASREEIDAFYAGMIHERFDLALQLHGGGRHSNQVVRRLGARLAAGLRTSDAPSLHRWIPYGRHQPEVLRYLEVVSLVGAPVTTLEPRLSVTVADLTDAERVVPDDGRPLVALHPGARHPERRWPAERFAAVGDALAAAGARVVVTGTEVEDGNIRRVLDGMTLPAENLCGRLSLGGLLGLYSRCAAVVSNDTGPLHLAAAAGAPTVGIYCAFNLVAYGPLSRTRHRIAVSWRDERRLCRPDCDDPYCERCEPFVADVPVDEVKVQALDLFTVHGKAKETRTESMAADTAVHSGR